LRRHGAKHPDKNLHEISAAAQKKYDLFRLKVCIWSLLSDDADNTVHVLLAASVFHIIRNAIT